MTSRRIDADWLAAPALQALLAALSSDGEAARVVGGAVRNTLLGSAVSDVDVATTALPETVIERVRAVGFKSVPTGIAHGTVTVVTTERSYEVTTLRQDVSTDGRHAEVRFGRDWQTDAERRDFTVNALYCDAGGEIYDLVGGVGDLDARRLRFIGDATKRIEEDYLRILRFFRFFAWYGEGRPDADGLRACSRLKSGLDRLSVERVWSELRKLLAAPDPSRSLLWMRQAGVLSAVLPESERWGIDAIHALMATERHFGWAPDPLLRLEAIVPPDAARLTEMAKRLRLSNSDRDRLLAFAHAEPASMGESEAAFRARLYFGDRQGIADRLRLALVSAHAKGDGHAEGMAAFAAYGARLGVLERFAPPAFPVSGEDLRIAGLKPGPDMGRTLDRLKRVWAESGFVLSRERLLEKAVVKDGAD